MEEQTPRVDLGVVPTGYAISGPKKVPRVDYERIFVLDQGEKLLGEYVLDDESPLDAEDLERAKPLNGMHHLVSFYLGEYAFTPFRVDDLWFVVLTRGVPRIEDRASVGALLAAARVHMIPAFEPMLASREALLREKEAELTERERLVLRREQHAGQVDAELRVTAMRLKEVDAELKMREAKLASLRDYAVRMQRTFIETGRPGATEPAKEPEPKPRPEVAAPP